MRPRLECGEKNKMEMEMQAGKQAERKRGEGWLATDGRTDGRREGRGGRWRRLVGDNIRSWFWGSQVSLSGMGLNRTASANRSQRAPARSDQPVLRLLSSSVSSVASATSFCLLTVVQSCLCLMAIFPPFGHLPPQIAKSHSFTHSLYSTRFDLFSFFRPIRALSPSRSRSNSFTVSGQRSAVPSARVCVRVELNCSLLKSIS